jgi:hypothetical protein
MRNYIHVIASAAKQSIYPRAETWIASLALAMTATVVKAAVIKPISRGVLGRG